MQEAYFTGPPGWPTTAWPVKIAVRHGATLVPGFLFQRRLVLSVLCNLPEAFFLS